MEEKDLIEKIKKSINNRPDMKNINDDYLKDVIEDAINDTKSFINLPANESVTDELITPIKDLCIIRINMTGTEGLSSSSKAGTSESYLDNIPKPVRRKLMKFRRLP